MSTFHILSLPSESRLRKELKDEKPDNRWQDCKKGKL